MNQTTPASTPLDTLKALTLRSIEQIESISDQLAGGGVEIPDHISEQLDSLRKMHVDALGEHMTIEYDQEWGLFWVLPREAHIYDDGSSVRGAFVSEGLTSTFFPRYDGSYAAAQRRHEELVKQMSSQWLTDPKGPHAPTDG